MRPWVLFVSVCIISLAVWVYKYRCVVYTCSVCELLLGTAIVWTSRHGAVAILPLLGYSIYQLLSNRERSRYLNMQGIIHFDDKLPKHECLHMS